MKSKAKYREKKGMGLKREIRQRGETYRGRER